MKMEMLQIRQVVSINHTELTTRLYNSYTIV